MVEGRDLGGQGVVEGGGGVVDGSLHLPAHLGRHIIGLMVIIPALGIGAGALEGKLLLGNVHVDAPIGQVHAPEALQEGSILQRLGHVEDLLHGGLIGLDGVLLGLAEGDDPLGPDGLGLLLLEHGLAAAVGAIGHGLLLRRGQLRPAVLAAEAAHGIVVVHVFGGVIDPILRHRAEVVAVGAGQLLLGNVKDHSPAAVGTLDTQRPYLAFFPVYIIEYHGTGTAST